MNVNTLKYEINYHETETDSDIENRLAVAEGWSGGGMEWELRISRHKILYTEQINR